jgi:hypothetical protein
LFGLLCWRAIFAPMPGAFFHPFHRAPADLASASFYARRRPIFEECLAELASCKYRDTIMDTLRRKRGTCCAFVSWRALERSLIERSLEFIPPAHLELYFRYLLLDLRENCAGFPDLIQFWPNGRYRLIEVKGPKDRLQPNQRRCLQHLLAHGLPVSVCRPKAAADALPPAPPTKNVRPAHHPPEAQLSFCFA